MPGIRWTESEYEDYIARGRKAKKRIEIKKGGFRQEGSMRGYRRTTKYNAKRMQIDNIWFDSIAEAQRYRDLKLIPSVKDIIVHPKFPIFIQCPLAEKPVKVCDVILDFHYRIADKYYFEDVKGVDTAISRLKRKMIEAAYGIKVEVIKKCLTKK